MGLTNAIFVVGPPGSGKSTQCSRLAQRFDCVHISAGELMRNVRDDPESRHHTQVLPYLQRGESVPAHITVEMLLERIALLQSGTANAVIIDGFPRSSDHMDELRKTSLQIKLVVVFDGDVDVFIRRCLARNDRLGEDSAQSLKIRTEKYESSLNGLKGIFANLKIPMIEVSTDQNNIEDIQCILEGHLRSLLVKIQ